MIGVTILTQRSCVFCDQAAEILHRLAPQYGLEIHEVSLDSEEGRTLAMRHGVMFAPGILLEGKLFSYGRLSEKKLRRHLTPPERLGSPGLIW